MNQRKKGPEPGSFTDLIAGYRNGRLLAELNSEASALALACAQLRKGGSITLTISLDPEQVGNGFDIHASISTKLPKPKLPKSQAFMDASGRLHRTDPAQAEMFAEVDHDPVTGEVIEGQATARPYTPPPGEDGRPKLAAVPK
ncbi:hypothetical protein TMCBR2_gp037c [Caulobacter phage TMCBR2]|uniref:Uncharacterized protein n=1 Tax=Caulobacter phage TMCBR2 TaxID=3025404 RepID=A0AAF0BTI3_9CAUD|nr:hypothetical protein TMCBR2_gp037c [Caulobacter phage TMCBR2]